MDEQVGFKRNIGLFLATMIGIGAMMGPGIFALPGPVAEMLGPIGFSVYLVVGLITVLVLRWRIGKLKDASGAAPSGAAASDD